MNSNLLIYSWICLQEIFLTVDSGEMDSQEWDSYKFHYNKKYEVMDDEDKKKKTYTENLSKIAEHNARFSRGEVSYEMGMNEFGDLTAKEFAERYLSKPTPRPVGLGVSKLQVTDEDQQYNITLPTDRGPVPRSRNWVYRRAMTRVKNQGTCGCCWAMAVVAAIEGHIFIKTKKKRSLSAQNVLDCVRDRYHQVNHCTIGSVYDALQYVKDNGGIEAESTYAYKEKQGDTCQYDPQKKAASIKDIKRLKREDEILLRDVVGLIGPVICGFHAEPDFIQFYKSGIFHSDTCEKSIEKINHSLVIAGYGTEGRLDYWLMKNSWGPQWGDQGYVKVSRGGNVCAVATDTYYPVV